MDKQENGKEEMDKEKLKVQERRFLSEGIRRLGLNALKNFVSFIPSNIPLVEVGSGNGFVARCLSETRKDKIICVDPLIKHCDPATCGGLQPDFATVKDLIKTSSHLIGKCALLLNWPYPNESTYDIESVQILQPRFLLVVYEPSGVSGGEEFFKMDDRTGYQS